MGVDNEIISINRSDVIEMLDETINAYRAAVLDPVIDVMKEEIASTDDPDKKNEIQHKIDTMISAFDEAGRDVLNGEAPDDRTAQAINNIAFEWIQNREYPDAVDILELEEQFDKD